MTAKQPQPVAKRWRPKLQGSNARDLAIANEAKDLFLKAFAERDGRITDAMDLAQVSIQQVKSWCRDDEHFRERMELVPERRRDKTRKVVYDKIDEGNERVVIKAMDSLPEFAKESRVKIEGSVDHNHHIDNMTLEEQARVIELGRQAIELERKGDGSYERS